MLAIRAIGLDQFCRKKASIWSHYQWLALLRIVLSTVLVRTYTWPECHANTILVTLSSVLYDGYNNWCFMTHWSHVYRHVTRWVTRSWFDCWQATVISHKGKQSWHHWLRKKLQNSRIKHEKKLFFNWLHELGINTTTFRAYFLITSLLNGSHCPHIDSQPVLIAWLTESCFPRLSETGVSGYRSRMENTDCIEVVF